MLADESPVDSAPLSARPHSPRRPGTSHAPTPFDAMKQITHSYHKKISGYRQFAGAARGTSYKTQQVKEQQYGANGGNSRPQSAKTPRAPSSCLFNPPKFNVNLDVEEPLPDGWNSTSTRKFQRMVSREQLDRRYDSGVSSRCQQGNRNRTTQRSRPVSAAPTRSGNAKKATVDDDFVDEKFYTGESKYTHSRPSPRTPSVLAFNRPTSAVRTPREGNHQKSASTTPRQHGNATTPRAPVPDGEGDVEDDYETDQQQLSEREYLRSQREERRDRRLSKKKGHVMRRFNANTIHSISGGYGGMYTSKRGVMMASDIDRDVAAFVAGTGRNPNKYKEKNKNDDLPYYGASSGGSNSVRAALLENEKHNSFEPYTLSHYDVKDNVKVRAPQFSHYRARDATSQVRRPKGRDRWRLQACADDEMDDHSRARPINGALDRQAAAILEQAAASPDRPANAYDQEDAEGASTTYRRGDHLGGTVSVHEATAETGETQRREPPQIIQTKLTAARTSASPRRTAAADGQLEAEQHQSPLKQRHATVGPRSVPQVNMEKMIGKDVRPRGGATQTQALCSSASTPSVTPINRRGVDRHVQSVNLAKKIPKPPPSGNGGTKYNTNMTLFPKHEFVRHRAGVPYVGPEPRQRKAAAGGNESPSPKRDNSSRDAQSPTTTTSTVAKQAVSGGHHQFTTAQNDKVVHPKVARDIYLGGSPHRNFSPTKSAGAKHNADGGSRRRTPTLLIG